MKALLQAGFVTFLWATSWVLIKVGLEDIPALTFAGLRYTLAFLVLAPVFARRNSVPQLRQISRGTVGQLLLLGLLFYAVTQGAQFLGLAYLPAVTVSLLLNFTPFVVAFLGILLLQERPSRLQWVGLASFLVGLFVYFQPATLQTGEVFGLAVVSLGVLANSASSLLGRNINRARTVDPLEVTTLSMGVGGPLLLLTGALVQGVPALSLENWAIVAWLSVVNTAFAFTLWNDTLRVISAVESSIINSTMLIQIAVLAWVFVGETLTTQEILGMAVVALGVVVAQLRPTSTEAYSQTS